MAKITKRYVLLKGMSLQMVFEVNGIIVPVSFKYGIRTPVLKRGMFSTDDHTLQEAIESSNGYNIEYTLEQTYTEPEEGDEFLEETTKKEDITPPDENKKEENTLPPADAVVDHPEIETVTAAKQLLLESFPDLKPGMLKNRLEVLRLAGERKISFSKLVI
jgi:hypothetical protein